MGISSYINRKIGRPFEHDFHLKAAGDTRKYSWKLKKGERLVGEVRADKEVSVYVLTLSSLWDFQYNSDCDPEWEAEDVTHASVSFTAPMAGKFHLLVTNEVDRDEDEEQDTLVHVRVRRER